MEKDPFTKVYDALWLLAERNVGLTNVIKLGNREKYDKWIGMKDSTSQADLPELALIMDGGAYNFNYSSSHSRLLRTYSWAITTGNFIVEDYNCIVWELCRAMVEWDTYVCGITWQEAQVVHQASQGEFTEGTMRVSQSRGIRGWSSIWSLEVEFWVPTTLMRITNPE